jgi:hypothetical protein
MMQMGGKLIVVDLPDENNKRNSSSLKKRDVSVYERVM